MKGKDLGPFCDKALRGDEGYTFVSRLDSRNQLYLPVQHHICPSNMAQHPSCRDKVRPPPRIAICTPFMSTNEKRIAYGQWSDVTECDQLERNKSRPVLEYNRPKAAHGQPKGFEMHSRSTRLANVLAVPYRVNDSIGRSANDVLVDSRIDIYSDSL